MVTAGSAPEGLQAFLNAVPDVLVCDLGLPGADGYALIRQIRELPLVLGGRTGAVALTAYSSEMHTKVMHAGFQAYLTKPVEPSKLVEHGRRARVQVAAVAASCFAAGSAHLPAPLSLHLGLLLAYSLFQVALGLWMGRHVKTSGEFFVAGRRLGPGLLFATLVAANIGAGSTVGATGLGYRDGLSAWWWVGSAAIGSLVLAFTVGPRIRRMAAEHDLHTVGRLPRVPLRPRVRGIDRRAAVAGHAGHPRRAAHRDGPRAERGGRPAARGPAASSAARS